MIVSPPRLVGTATVAPLFGVRVRHLYSKLEAREPLVLAGYLGKIGKHHVWNLHELVASLFTSDAALEMVIDRLTDRTPSDPLDTVLCSTSGCDEVEELIGLCPRHLHQLHRAWRKATRSSLATVQLVGMCQWIVERNAHLVLPPDFDPWSLVCLTPGCDGETNGNGHHGPLCPSCTAKFWNNPPGRRASEHWKAAS
ncbi:hypothetical protein BH10ACT3_BH10ACT3_19890 [soil metagenome]